MIKKLMYSLGWGFLIAVVVTVAIGKFPYEMYPIHTESMYPALPMKTLIIVEKGYYHQGDIITFNHQTGGAGNEVVTHRFIGRDKNGLIVTKGDANPSTDVWPTSDSDVVGSVVLQIPQAGYWLVYLKNPAGLASFLLTLIAFWLLWPELRRSRRVKAS